MAMSKKCFLFTLGAIIIAVVGAVVFVAIRMQDFTQPEEVVEVEEEVVIKTSADGISPERALRMCQSILNGTEPSPGTYNHPVMYEAVLGESTISSRVLETYSGDTYQKSSYWLIGDVDSDRAAMSSIRFDACKGKIPVIVIAIRPNKGLKLSPNGRKWNYYKPESLVKSWEDYDKTLNRYLKALSPIPSIVILEPDLLMYSFDTANMQYGWLNDKYKEEFYHRAQRIIKILARSWVYVDAGNGAYLKVRSNMETTAKSLLRLEGLRGFAINTGHFFNSSFNNAIARRLHCLTGLHYITDTSRNGGSFTRQGVNAIQTCYFDPPRMLAGLPPGWSWGIKSSPRQKRWILNFPNQDTATQPGPSQNQQQSQSSSPSIVSHRQPPNQHENPEEYNQWVNEMRNNGGGNIPNQFQQQGSIQQRQPNNFQPSNPNNQNRGNYYNDLAQPTGRVPVSVRTAAPRRKTSTRNVKLRSVQEALLVYRGKALQRSRCLRKEPVSVHDANVWIKTPGESDGRLYEYGTYHKCLLGHTKACDEECKLIVHKEQRSTMCGCEQTKRTTNSQSPQPPQPSQPINLFGGGSSDNRETSENSEGVFFPDETQILYSSNPAEPESAQSGPVQSGPPSLADLLRQGTS